MAEPDWNPDTGGRSLAEILREAGIESASRQNRRRRWDDPEETGLRQRRAEAAAAEGAAARAGQGRRKSDVDDPPPPRRERELRREQDAPRAPAPRREPSRGSLPRDPGPLRDPAPARESGPPVERRQKPRRPPDPSTAAIPGLRPDRKPGVPSGPAHSGPVPSGATAFGAEPFGAMPSGPAPFVERRSRERPPQRAVEHGAGSAPQRAVSVRGRPEEGHFNTGPIPVVRPDDIADAEELDSTPRESALAWLRFAGELLIALAAGVGIYFTATLLWENVPYLAVLLVPLAVTGLVAGVGAWRHRQGREPVGPRLLAVLVIAGTLLTIAPAAALLAAS
ncbi:MAG: hypothetical protein JWQ99_2521 [Blastococcus sp.]|jgi:hypothetical protein|nr:hypothetical protein [Blastococcus sp.]